MNVSQTVYFLYYIIMYLKIQQSEIWRFNRAWTEKSLVFSLKITDNDWLTISQKDSEWNEVKAVFKPWRKNEDDGNLEYIKDEYEDLFNDFQINKLLSLADLENYEDENIFFFKTIKENYEQIRNNFIKDRKDEIQRKIDSLIMKLSNFNVREDEYVELNWLSKKIDMYKSRYETEEKKLKDCIEWSETYKEVLSKYEKYKWYYNKLVKKIN